MCRTFIGGIPFDWGSRTYVMGILNVTPDSFSDGGKYPDEDSALLRAVSMINEGADMIDIGGESTRPGSKSVDVGDELKRVIPAIEIISRECDMPISVDTYRAETADAAIRAGADMINDVWGLKADPEMAAVAAGHAVPICLMHNRAQPDYVNLIEDVKRDLGESINLAVKNGIIESNIIIDPGIGFGKTMEHNIEIMSKLDEFRCFGYPVLLGVSRKSFLGRILDLPVEARLEGTLAANVLGIMRGADIIRVHDVMQNKRAAAVADVLVRING